ALQHRGASFLRDLAGKTSDGDDLLVALGELAAAGLVTSDGFAGLRALVRAASGRAPSSFGHAHAAGRWSLLRAEAMGEAAAEAQARSLLRRYGVVFRRVLAREANALPWRQLSAACRR